MQDVTEFEPLWGVWKIDETIGEGSFGTVYRVFTEDIGGKKYSAVKHISIPTSDYQITEIISEGVSGNANAVKDYFQTIANDLVNEIDFMNELKGKKNIVLCREHMVIEKPSGIGYDIFIRMELLTGLNSIANRIHFTNSDVIRLGIDLCTALEDCAEKGIIHRDIKPSNIFINGSGTYKLGDFGVARELAHTTAAMSKKGTYSYMSPEIYMGDSVNLTADIFSLGIVMYRLLNANRAPFLSVDRPIEPTDNEMALVRRMSGEELPSPAFADERLAKIILKATQFDRTKRYSSPTEMKNELIALQKSMSNGQKKGVMTEVQSEMNKLKSNNAALSENTDSSSSLWRRFGLAAAAVTGMIALLAAIIIPLATGSPETVLSHDNSPDNNDILSADALINESLATWKPEPVYYNNNYFTADDLKSGNAENTFGGYGHYIYQYGDNVYYQDRLSLNALSLDGSTGFNIDNDVSNVCFYEDKIFYSKNDGTVGIFTYDITEQKKQLILSGDNDRNIRFSVECMYNNRLYYIATEENDRGQFINNEILSFDMNTGDVVHVTSLANYCAFSQVYNDKLYFWDLGQGLFSCDLDGGDVNSIIENKYFDIGYFVICNDKIYTVLNKKLLVCDLFGRNRRILSDDEALDISVYENKLYYTTYSTHPNSDGSEYAVGGSLKCLDISSSTLTTIFENECRLTGCSGNWIYFENWSGEQHLCRIRLDGTGFMEMPI